MLTYAEKSDMFNLAMKHLEKPCIGDECDGEVNCKRHSRTLQLVIRINHMSK